MNSLVGRVHVCDISTGHPALVHYVTENGTDQELTERAFSHRTHGAHLWASDLIPDGYSFCTNIYHEFFRPLRMKYVVGLILELAPDSITQFRLIKPHYALDSCERDLNQLRDLQPDLTQIWHGCRHLATIQERLDTLQSLWDCFEHAVIVTDNSQNIQFANRAAESLLRANQWVASIQGKLVGATAPIQARLISGIEKLRCHQHEIISLTPESGASSGNIMATLFRISDDQVALILTNPAISNRDFTTALQQCYEMTATESDVINALLSSQSLRDYADQHKVSYETARTHLKNAMKKNGWRRQGEMIVQILARLCPATEFSSP